MSQVVTELVIDSKTQGAADFERAMLGAEAASRRGTDAANDFNINLLAVGAAAVTAGLAIKKGLDEVVGFNKELADLQGLAERVGLSLKDLQGVQLGAKIAGLSDNQINAGLEKSAQLLNDAQRNVNTLSRQFEAEGVSIRNANGQLISQNQLLQVSAEMIRRAASPQDAIAIAQMLGYTKEWVPFLRQGGEAMRQLGDEAAKAGAVIDDDTIQRAADFDREWRKSSVEWTAYMKAAAAGMLPTIDELIQRAAKFVKEFDRSKVEAAAQEQLASLGDNVGLPREGGFRIGMSPETEKAIQDWRNADLPWLDRFAAIVTGLRSTVQRLSPQDYTFAAGAAPVFDTSDATMMAGRWQAQADSFGKASAQWKAGAAEAAEGFTKVASRADQAGDAVDRAINSLRKHIEMQGADAAAIGQGARAHAELRAEAAQSAAVQANGGKITREQAAAFAQLKKEAGDSAEALARARVNQEIRFGAQTALLSPQDVAIANQLKDVYPDVEKALASAEAAQLRYNAALKDMGNAFANAAASNLTDFELGLKSGGDALRDFEKQFARTVLNMINQWLMFKAIAGFGLFSGGSITSLIPSAHGNVFSAGNVVPFAQGGVIGGPTLAPMALMGEAGPEAVVPLKRDMRGNLGVAGGGNSTSVYYQIDASGADAGTVQRISQVLDRHARTIAAQGKAIAGRAHFAETGVMS